MERTRISEHDFANGLFAALRNRNIANIRNPNDGAFDTALAVAFPVFRFRAEQAGYAVRFRIRVHSLYGASETAYQIRLWWMTLGIATLDFPQCDIMRLHGSDRLSRELFNTIPGDAEWYCEAAQIFLDCHNRTAQSGIHPIFRYQ